MVTLHETAAAAVANTVADTLANALVEWTVLALGVAVAMTLLLRARSLFRRWLPCLAFLVIAANAGIAIDAAAAAARSEAAAAWNPSNAWYLPQPAVQGGPIAGVAGAGSAVLVLVCALAWVCSRHGQRRLASLPLVVPQSVPICDGIACRGCLAAGDASAANASALNTPARPGRRRARGLTITRLGEL